MPNIADALHSTLGSSQFGVARRIASACAELGCCAYVVGGTVRDALLGLPAADLDVTVVAPPDDFPRLAADILDARVVMVSQFGTAKLELDGTSFDLVMARSERYRVPGALPDVRQGSLDDDLARRDFTINCMAASLDIAAWGELIDPHGGQRDLELGLVRTLHEESFQDDPTQEGRGRMRVTSRSRNFVREPEIDQLISDRTGGRGRQDRPGAGAGRTPATGSPARSARRLSPSAQHTLSGRVGGPTACLSRRSRNRLPQRTAVFYACFA
ncbi:MAG: hypothetical protein IIB17_06135 [Chloroflexi bacterium]|nr:hypothetical protein [Chloroflexota bacterium]